MTLAIAWSHDPGDPRGGWSHEGGDSHPRSRENVSVAARTRLGNQPESRGLDDADDEVPYLRASRAEVPLHHDFTIDGVERGA